MVSSFDLMSLRHALGGRPIVIVGMMGAGKTTIGKRLASKLQLSFADSDRAVEEAARRSVAEIFESYGEEAFRDCERRVIARLLHAPDQVVALGGGAWTHPETRAVVAAKSISVWLDADVETLLERVRRRATRPLLQTADPARTLADLDRTRRPLYALADIRVKVGQAHHYQVVDSLTYALSRYLGMSRRDAG
jgi:shikimate kinase